jgi:hypothetical protein
MSEIHSVTEQFSVRRWHDPIVEAFGFPVNSIYIETVLLPILGPSSVLCLRRLGAWATGNPDGTLVDTRQLAGDLGLGDGMARNSPIARTLNRLCQFGMAYWHDEEELSVRTAVAPLAERQLHRLSAPVLELHRSLVRQSENRRSVAGPNHAKLRPLLEADEAGLSRRLGAGL